MSKFVIVKAASKNVLETSVFSKLWSSNNFECGKNLELIRQRMFEIYESLLKDRMSKSPLILIKLTSS